MEFKKSRRKKFCNATLQQPFPLFIESELGISLDNWVPIIYTGRFNGLGVSVEDPEDVKSLYSMGYFGKGSMSRSAPKILRTSKIPPFIRQRQYLRRKSWWSKYKKSGSDWDENIVAIQSQISQMSKSTDESVIELLSSDDESGVQPVNENVLNFPNDSLIVMPDSDHEMDYFENIKPELCIDESPLKESLMLTLQESFFLTFGLGNLQIHGLSGEQLSLEESWQLFNGIECNFAVSYAVYHYFRAKGYVVKPGLKFGGDFLLYKDGPPFYHADYIVIVESVPLNNYIEEKTDYDWISLQGMIRMATDAFKEVLIAQVAIPNDLELKELQKNPQLLEKLTINELLFRRGLQEKDKE